MSQRYAGTVLEFKVQRGFGYLKLDMDDEHDKDKNKVFVHWKEIHTDDRWPALEAGMEVEYGIEKEQRGRYQARHVTLPGGGKIVIDPNKGAEKIFGKHSGTVTFYNYRNGFGFIELSKPVPGVDLGEKNRLHVARNEIVSDDEPPTLKQGQKVVFSIIKNDKGYSARNVTAPGGKKIHNPKPPSAGGRRNVPNNQGNQVNWSSGPKRQRNGPSGWGGGRDPSFQKRPRRPMYVEQKPDQQVEVGLCVKKLYVGGLIGKRGVTIKQMKRDSGAVLQLGDDDIFWDGDAHRVMAISGLNDEVVKACKLVAKHIGDAAQSLDHKITYLVPEDALGMLIGKQGANLKKIQGEKPNERVRINITDEAVQLPGANRVKMCSLFGGQANVARAIDTIVDTLGWISLRIQAEQAMQQQQAEQAMQQQPQHRGGPVGGGGYGFQAEQAMRQRAEQAAEQAWQQQQAEQAAMQRRGPPRGPAYGAPPPPRPSYGGRGGDRRGPGGWAHPVPMREMNRVPVGGPSRGYGNRAW